MNKETSERKDVIYNINSAAPCCELHHSQTVSLRTPQAFVPLSLIHLLLGRHCGRPAIKLTGTSLFYMWLLDTAQQEQHYGLTAREAQ